MRLDHPCNRLLEMTGLFFLVSMPFMMFLGIVACDISLSTIAVLFLIRSVLIKDFSWLNIRWIQIALILWAYTLILSFYALVNVKASFSQAIPFCRFIFFAAGLQCWLLKSADYRRYLLYALTATVLLMTVNILFSFLTGLSLLGKSATQYGHYTHITWLWQRPYGRIMGLNGKMNAGIMLTWVAMPFFVFMASIMKHKKRHSFVAALLALLLVMMAISITGDRMAFLECGFGCFLLFLFLPDLRWPFFLTGGILLLLLAGVFLFDPGLYHRNLVSLFKDTAHFSHDSYGVIARTAAAIFWDHPIFGVGLKQYSYLSSSLQYSHLGGFNTHTQNLYLEWITGTGLIGILLFLSMLYCWFKQFFLQRSVICGLPIAVGVFVGFILRAWPLASTTSFFFSWGAITFWWMAAWLLAITD